MSQVMTWQEINSAYPDEWVLIVEPDTGPDLKVRSGVVAYHGQDRNEAYRKAKESGAKRVAILYLGDPFPPDMIPML
jgi:hypothetical protein